MSETPPEEKEPQRPAKPPRLRVVGFADKADVFAAISNALRQHASGMSEPAKPLLACCDHAAQLGAQSSIIQERVLDPDFLAEFNAYYSRQFANCGRYCLRVHFFRTQAQTGELPLEFLQRVDREQDYLGFITLRPVGRSPVGASFLTPADTDARIRCMDHFPVHVGGIRFDIIGTPFLQQDNAVGACAQASIWMALRTMRKREGDRAFDPAQISGAATRFSVAARILPNRAGLTWPQMLDAVRGAGYSPHQVRFTAVASSVHLATTQVREAKRQIVVYLDSEIPVLLLLFPPPGGVGHAVVAIGYRFTAQPAELDFQDITLESKVGVQVPHAAGWVSELIVHNDNSGPYLPLLDVRVEKSYALEQAYSAIPLLPADVFLTGEEAMTIATNLWLSQIQDITQEQSANEVAEFTQRFVVRLLLLEKRRLRAWAITSGVAPEVAEELRLGDLPRRVWAMEIHLRDEYANHAKEEARSVVGFYLLDSTGDDHTNTILMSFLNFPVFTELPTGVLLRSVDWDRVQTQECPLLPPFRPINQSAKPPEPHIEVEPQGTAPVDNT